ncbi:MAG: hypothetical protein ATN35_06030 [Epulopiscium sp. Nele67-Bin004]|nr:MAG: hypothetical protein ATN35_06030 [Epulopiscium sp. Nele67-Bin004]
MVKEIKPNQYNQHTDNGEGYCYTYDIKGRIVTVIAPDGTVVQTNTYDEFGRLINQVDANNSGINVEYDLQGNKTKIQTMGGAKQTFSYDARGNIVGTTDGENNQTTYTLDEWGRITQVNQADISYARMLVDYAVVDMYANGVVTPSKIPWN